MSEEKNIDESWKESAAQQKENLKDAARQGEGKIHLSESAKAQIKAEEEEQKAQAQQQEQQPASEQPSQEEAMQVNFLNYISSLAFQAMIFLGEIEHPVTKQNEKNLDQAKFLIDTLVVIREKTKGNLDQQEENMLNASIYELQMKFVDAKQKEDKA